MGCRQKLLLSFMVEGLMLFYGIAMAAALTPPEIAIKSLKILRYSWISEMLMANVGGVVASS